ncbi:hypothetical protein IB030_000588 [Campylobacter jejuni]|nr:hypothetical protein [Campylobacter jejuni]
MFDFFVNYIIFCAKDLAKLFLGRLALILFFVFAVLFFICENVFLLHILAFCEILLFLYMLLGIFYIRNERLFCKIFNYFIFLQKLFKRKT